MLAKVWVVSMNWVSTLLDVLELETVVDAGELTLLVLDLVERDRFEFSLPSMLAWARFGMVKRRAKMCPRSSNEMRERRMARARTLSPLPA